MRKLVLAALAVTAFAATMAVNTNDAKAVIYCTSTGVPAGCIVRPVAPVANWASNKDNSLTRPLMEKTLGIDAKRDAIKRQALVLCIHSQRHGGAGTKPGGKQVIGRRPRTQPANRFRFVRSEKPAGWPSVLKT